MQEQQQQHFSFNLEELTQISDLQEISSKNLEDQTMNLEELAEISDLQEISSKNLEDLTMNLEELTQKHFIGNIFQTGRTEVNSCNLEELTEIGDLQEISSKKFGRSDNEFGRID